MCPIVVPNCHDHTTMIPRKVPLSALVTVTRSRVFDTSDEFNLTLPSVPQSVDSGGPVA
jgi:hypothetical protein